MVARDGLPAVIVNPSTPIGPRDVKPTPTGRIVVEAAMGRMPAFVDTGLNLVHVDDCARGHLLALHRGRVGERYFLGGQDVTLAEILGEIEYELTQRAATERPTPSEKAELVERADCLARRLTELFPLDLMVGARPAADSEIPAMQATARDRCPA